MKFTRFFGAIACVAIALFCVPTFSYAELLQGQDTLGVKHVLKQAPGGGAIVTLRDLSTTDWSSGPVVLSSGTSTLLVASAPNLATSTATAQRRYVEQCQIGTLAATTAVTVSLLDHLTVVWTMPLAAGAAFLNVPLNDLIKTAAGATNHELNVQLSGAPTGNVTVNCQGHTRP